MHAVATLPQEETKSTPTADLALDLFEPTPLRVDPFDHVLLAKFLNPADCAAGAEVPRALIQNEASVLLGLLGAAMISGAIVAEHPLASLNCARREDVPFRHWLLDNLLPDRAADALRALPYVPPEKLYDGVRKLDSLIYVNGVR